MLELIVSYGIQPKQYFIVELQVKSKKYFFVGWRGYEMLHGPFY